MKATKQSLRSRLGGIGRKGRAAALAGLSTIPLMMMSTQAHAVRFSELFSGMKQEAGIIVPIVLLIIMAIGICIAGWAVISGIMAKRRNEPLQWQMAGVIGGAIAIIFPLILLALAGSLSDEQGNAEGVMSELNIQY